MTKHKRGRKEGTRVLYTPDQTQRYQSQWRRYEEGLKLAASGEVLKVDDETYRIPSERSSVGYWEVKKKPKPQGDWYVSGIEGASVIGIGGTLTHTYAGQITDASWRGQSPFFNIPVGSVVKAYMKIRVEEPKDKPIGIMKWSMISGIHEYPGRAIADFGVYLAEAEETYEFVVEKTPISFRCYGDWGSENIIPPAKVYGIHKFTFADLEDGDGSYECSCPDFSKREDAFNPAYYPSQSQSRDWLKSAVGAPTWSDGKRRCKHIVAVQRISGDEIPVPGDIPLGSE